MTEPKESPELIAARIANLEAERDHYRAQTRKETAEAEAAELDLRTKRRNQELAEAKDVEHRIYHFTSQVSDSSVESCMATLAAWVRVAKEPITINFYSPGGSVISGLRLYDFLRRLVEEDGITLTTITLGYAASMAGVLLQAASDGCRVVGPNAHVLVHEVSAGAVGKIGELEDSVDFSKALNQRLFGILAGRAKVSKAALLRKAKRKDVWLDAEETVNKFGLADRIGYR